LSIAGTALARPAVVVSPELVDAERVQDLLERCAQRLFASPAEALASAEQAAVMANALRSSLGRREHADLAAQVQACLAVALQASDRREAADLAFGRAHHLVAEGSRAVLATARVDRLFAAYLRERGQVAEALQRLRRSSETFLAAGSVAEAARSLVAESVILGQSADVHGSLKLLRQAWEMADETTPARTVLTASLSLGHALHRSGYDLPAFDLLRRTLETADRRGDLRGAVITRWLLTRVEVALGRRAEPVLRRLLDDCLQLDLPYEAALLSIELALVCLDESRIPDLRRVARDMFDLYTHRKFHRVAAGALIAARDQISTGRAERHRLERIWLFLVCSRYDEGFDPHRLGPGKVGEDGSDSPLESDFLRCVRHLV